MRRYTSAVLINRDIRNQQSIVRHSSFGGISMQEIEDIEINLLTEAIYHKYGYDFREYSYPSLRRRVINYLDKSKFRYVSEIIPELLRSDTLFEDFTCSLSVSVTEMFRDPWVYKKIREEVVPLLRSFPRINIWHAGCCTGEEVYSFAILLKEEGLYDRSTIYATDINSKVLKIAESGIFPIAQITKGTENYLKTGGVNNFSDYYHAKYGNAIIDKALKKNITFSTHNLVHDGVFNQMHLIVCRNVLIYFTKNLQDRVFDTFNESLIHNGILILGTKESLNYTQIKSNYQELSKKMRIYKKVRSVNE